MWLRSSLRRLLDRPDGRLTTYRDRHRIAALISLLPIPLPRIPAVFGSDEQRPGAHSYGEILAWRCLFSSFRHGRI